MVTKYQQDIPVGFWLPAWYLKRCVAPMLCGNFRTQNFRGPSWTKKVPETHRESRKCPTIFGPPRCASNAAWRPCFAKISVPKFAQTPFEEEGSEDNLATKFPGQTANPAHVPQVLAPRVVPPTLRAPQLRKNFRGQNLRGPSWRNKLPKTHREPV